MVRTIVRWEMAKSWPGDVVFHSPDLPGLLLHNRGRARDRRLFTGALYGSDDADWDYTVGGNSGVVVIHEAIP